MNYKELSKRIAGFTLPISATNEKGENVIIERGANGGEAGKSLTVLTSQKNGYVRINTYYEDGSSEELFER